MQQEWNSSNGCMSELLTRFGYQDTRDLLDSLVTPAASGNMKVATTITGIFDQNKLLDYENWQSFMGSATVNGHIDVLRFLMSKIIGRVDTFQMDGILPDILEGAAANWHLEIVKYAIQCAHEKPIMYSSALACAVSGGHNEVSQFLLKLEGHSWNLIEAFVAAVKVEHKPFAEKFYEIYPHYNEEKRLFVELAGSGYLDALRYLYSNGWVNAELVEDAFIKAADGCSVIVMEWLFDTGLVSLYGWIWQVTADCSYWLMERHRDRRFFYNKNCASTETINSAMTLADRLSSIRLFHKNGHLLWDNSRSIQICCWLETKK